MANNVDLSLTIKAIDKATGPLRAVTAKLNALTSPMRGFSKDLGDLSKAAGLGEISKAFGGVGSAARNVAGEVVALGAKLFAVGAAGTFALFSIVKGAIDAGDKLSEMAQRTGLAVDTYASLQFAAAQADVEQEAFNSAMDKFNKNLGEAKAGGGALLTFLNKVGPGLAKQIKGAKSSEEALSFMTDALTRIEDPQRRAALAAAAFGKSGLQMGQFLGQGSAKIQEAQREYIRLHGSAKAFADGASDVDNAIKKTGVALEGVRDAAVTALFPAITKITNGLTDFMVKHRDSIAQWADRAGKAITAWVDGGGIDRLVAGLGKFAEGVGKVIDFLGPMGSAVVAMTPLLLPLLGSVFSLGGAMVNLVAAIAPFAPAIGSALLAVAPFAIAIGAVAAAGYQLYKNWGDLVFIFKDWATTIDLAIQRVGGLWALLKDGPAVGAFKLASELFRTPDENGALTPEARVRVANMNAAAARPQVSRSTSDARVSVSFENVPPGARVSTDPASTANVSTDVGRSMESH